MTDNNERAQVGQRFWLWWVLASTVGLAVGIVVDLIPVLITLGEIGGGAVGLAVFGIVLGTVVGVSVGIAQWLVLRGQVPWASLWVLATAVGGGVGGAVAFNVGKTVGRAVGVGALEGLVGASVGAVVGASVGIAQWLVLRGQVPWASLWVLASTVGGVVAWSGDVIFTTNGIIEAKAGALAGYGAITGAVMVWLLRQSGIVTEVIATEESSFPEYWP